MNNGDLFMHYKSIFQDVRGAVDWVHLNVSTAPEFIQSLPVIHPIKTDVLCHLW